MLHQRVPLECGQEGMLKPIGSDLTAITEVRKNQQKRKSNYIFHSIVHFSPLPFNWAAQLIHRFWTLKSRHCSTNYSGIIAGPDHLGRTPFAQKLANAR